MKKILSVLALSAIVLSCSDDDSNSTQESFFNLKDGNLWVYKKYIANAEGVESFSGITDSVTVSGNQTIGDVSYVRLVHEEYNQSIKVNEREEFVRVDESGHLVNEQGVVIHPGADFNFQDTQPVNDGSEVYGELNYTLNEMQNVTVEGQNYSVYPYVAMFVSDPEHNLPEGVGCFNNYSAGIGMVAAHARFVSGTDYIEYRLTDYDIN